MLAQVVAALPSFGYGPAFLQTHGTILLGHRNIYVLGLAVQEEFCSFYFENFALRAVPVFELQCGCVGSSG